MAPVGGDALGSWLLSSASVSPDLGVFSLLLLIIVSIFLTSLCSDCGRGFFDLHELKEEKTPSALCEKVAKLDKPTSARENPMIDNMKNDELESSVPVQSSEDESGTWFTPWRSHLGTQKQPEIDVALGGDDQGADHNTTANQLDRLRDTAEEADPMYALVSRKEKPWTPSGVSAPDRHPEEEEQQPAPALLDTDKGWEG